VVTIDGRDGRDLRRARLAVIAMFFLNGLVSTAWVARIPQVKDRVGVDDAALGAVLLSAPAGLVVAVRLAGAIAGRWGERTTTLGSGTFAALSLIASGVAWNPPSLVAALLLFGGAVGLMDVTMNAQGVRVERGYGRPLMSGFHGAFSLGAVGGALSGSLAAGWAIPVVAHLSFMAFTVVALLWALARGPVVPSSGTPAALESASASPLAEHRWVLARLGLIGLCAFVGEGAMADWSAVFVRDVLHAAPGIAGLAYAGCAACMTTGRLAGDAVVARFGPSRVLRAGSSVAAVGLAGGLLVGGAAPAILGFSLFGLGVAVVAPVTFGAAGNLPGVPAASGISRVTSIGYLGLLGGPPVIGLLAQVAGLRSALLVVAALAAVIMLLAGAVAGAPRPATR
jgi:fucose permease